MSKRLISAVLLAATLGFTTGCATPGEPTISGSPAPTSTPSQSFAAMTPAEAKLAYKKIAEASCDSSLESGVVEITGDTKTVMIPKANAYKDFNAAYFTAPDTYELIWEIDGLYSCADWFTFSMSEEAGVEAEIDVTFDEKTGKYSTTLVFDEEVYQYVSTITNGKISSVYSAVAKTNTSVKYGNLTPEDQKILTTAVDRYLATVD